VSVNHQHIYYDLMHTTQPITKRSSPKEEQQRIAASIYCTLKANPNPINYPQIHSNPKKSFTK
jgi:hypothetical protein